MTFIALTIAIIVNAVADLVLRQNRTLANDLPRNTSRRAGHARRRRIATSRAKSADSFVDLSVAIVVQVIAGLGRWSNRTHASAHTIGALHRAGDAFARIRSARSTRQTFVALTIAVVIDAVTHLRGWTFGILTNPTTRDTSQRSSITRRRERTIAITRSTRRRTPVRSAKRAAIARKRPAAIHSRRRTIGERRFIRLSVAIVIEVVAGFWRRTYSPLTNQCPADTCRQAR